MFLLLLAIAVRVAFDIVTILSKNWKFEAAYGIFILLAGAALLTTDNSDVFGYVAVAMALVAWACQRRFKTDTVFVLPAI